jgi:hypothetical protein
MTPFRIMKYILLLITLVTATANAQHTDSLAKDSTKLNEMLLQQQTAAKPD